MSAESKLFSQTTTAFSSTIDMKMDILHSIASLGHPVGIKLEPTDPLETALPIDPQRHLVTLTSYNPEDFTSVRRISLRIGSFYARAAYRDSVNNWTEWSQSLQARSLVQELTHELSDDMLNNRGRNLPKIENFYLELI